jgi:hypothetical protein
MPKLIFAAAATTWFPRPPGRPRAAEAHAAMTRSRDTTRRLRASKAHEASIDLGPLDLTRRH